MFKLDIGNDLEISCKWYGFGLKGQRSALGLMLTTIRRGFELYECLLVHFDRRAALSGVPILLTVYSYMVDDGRI